MAATSIYPVAGDPIVRGDPLTIIVPVTTNGAAIADLDTWTWRAQVRSYPDGPILASFAIAAVEAGAAGLTSDDLAVLSLAGDDPVLVMSLTGEQTATLSDGDGFDLEATAPVPCTLWQATLRIAKDFSHG